MVTVQLPVYNELYVVDRLLDAIGALDYPRDRIEVQVLDDSDDATCQRIARRVAELRGRGLDIVHLRRETRSGYKAGALAAGLARARGELVCLFDADFAPRPDFLRRVVSRFEDPEVGMVQARWEHLNRDHSLLTEIQAMFLDAHFVIEHGGRCRSGRFFNFNGTAGIWRREAIEDAGGWQHDTLTEDLDLSYRAQMRGWRFVYVDEPAAPAELPASIAAFKSQQRRWTRGAVQTARKLLGRIWRAPLPLAVKLEASFHMTANVAYPLMLSLSVLVFPALLLRRDIAAPDPLWLDVPVLVCATGSVCLFFALAQRELGRGWWRGVVRLPALMALGAGLSIGNTAAVLGGLRGPAGEFQRTPKHALSHRRDIRRPRVYRSRQGWVPAMEGAFAAYFVGATAVALQLQMYASLPVLLLFLGGYGYVFFLSLVERRERGADGHVLAAADN